MRVKAKSVLCSPLPKRVVILSALSLALAMGLPPAVRAQAAACDSAVPTVTLNKPSGSVCGFTDSTQVTGSTQSVSAYVGIPYAQAPTKEAGLRWKNTKALTAMPSTPVPFQAIQYGNICPQAPGGAPPPTSCPAATNCPSPLPTCTYPKPTQSEDCLYLNVWVPKGSPPASGWPVMVYIHGGAFIEGSGSAPLFDGTYLAATGNEIVVSFNYRLGVLGFLAMKGITDDNNNNFGFRDQIMALQWVQDNIQGFGGDKLNVTIFGESAGAMSVGLHALSSPSRKPLFKRAMMESNPLGVPYKDLPTATEVGNHFARWIVNGVWGCSAKCMQKKSVADLMTAEVSSKLTAWAVSPLKAGLKLESLLLWSPALDRTLLLKTQPVNAGGSLNVPMLLGTNQNEGTEFAFLAASGIKKKYKTFGPNYYSDMLGTLFGIDAGVEKQSSSRYACKTKGSDCTPQLANVFTDFLFTCSNRYLATHAPTPGDLYMYYFNQVPSSACFWPVACICSGQVCHADELPFVFNTPEAVCPTSYKFQPDEEKLSQMMSGFWNAFGSQGSPNGSWQPLGNSPNYNYYTLNENI